MDRYLVELTKTLKERERLFKHSLLRLRNLLFAYVFSYCPMGGSVAVAGWVSLT